MPATLEASKGAAPTSSSKSMTPAHLSRSQKLLLSQNTTKVHEETHSSTQKIGINNCCHVVVYCQTKLSCNSKIPERCQHLLHWYCCASGFAGNNLLVSLAQHRQQLIRREHEPKATKLLSPCEQQAATREHERSPRKNQGTTSQRKMNARRHQ